MAGTKTKIRPFIIVREVMVENSFLENLNHYWCYSDSVKFLLLLVANFMSNGVRKAESCIFVDVATSLRLAEAAELRKAKRAACLVHP
jgi:hypothetical protein